MLEWIKEFFGIRDLRELEGLNPGSPRWRDLKSKLNNLRVEYRSNRVRQRKIRGIVANVGAIQFQRGDETVTIEVGAPSLPFAVIRSLAHRTYRHISANLVKLLLIQSSLVSILTTRRKS